MEDQQSLAIGKGGQNVRLAAKLTGWKIDIKSLGQSHAEDAAKGDELAPVEADNTNSEVSEDSEISQESAE
jgi:N utilization substance protein A